MKRRPWSVWFGIAGVVLAGNALAHTTGHKTAAHSHAAMSSAKATTLKGEIVDTGCYASHAGRGPEHVTCAAKCIANGMPMGLLTADGAVYLVTLDHDNLDPYNRLKSMAGQTVEITGPQATRGGLKTIQASEVKPAATASAK